MGYPATVSDFYLDKYEITVGRFRQFVNAGMGTQASPPVSGAGAHPLVAGSGWDPTWNANLPADTASLRAAIKCNSTLQTWTDTAGTNENRPQNCIDWYAAFAFCAWDGGRLATESEWNYAAAGGSEQTEYPWGSGIDYTKASYDCMGDGIPGCAVTDMIVVGTKPAGNGRWGQADLAGNVFEWTLDWYATYQTPCSDCADLATASFRVLRGGNLSNGNATSFRSADRDSYGPGSRDGNIGSRCARTSSTGGRDAAVPDAPAAQPDVPIGGSGGSGGTGGSGGVPVDGGTPPPSCTGLPTTCGPSGTESCCTSLLVPGGTFYRSYDGVDYPDMSYPATVSDFYLDKYEITVGRFRQFVNAGMGTQANPPARGAGANSRIAGSGWDPTWNTSLPADTASLKAAMKCNSTFQNWTDTLGAEESQPQNCMDWYTAFAFCAWDGGRLPTEAEWNYAAAGGTEQRAYPWSIPATSTIIDDSYVVYCGSSCNSTQNVGSKSPKGDGKWGQADLAGNVWEWTLDWYESPYPMPCSNCADLTGASLRAARGGGFNGLATYFLRSAFRNNSAPGSHDYVVGSRCVRTSSTGGAPGGG
jgi:formylglycine-generating enzyme required for sulfatase activity